MKKNIEDGILADTPLVNPEDDRLGFEPFAKCLANSIAQLKTKESLVFALYGPWGTGKTSCLNFVKYYLSQLPENDKPIVYEFNPWWFSGKGELIGQFFREFSIALGRKGKFKRAVKFIANLLEVTSEIPGSKTMAWLMNKAGGEKSVIRIKNDISEALVKSNKRFFIMIDDIDRLTSEEIRNLFCVIKAIADFPNTSYLLAFDKKIVVNALQGVQEGVGEEYLEKVVQVPFDLPIPDRSGLNKLFFEKLDTIFSESDADSID